MGAVGTWWSDLDREVVSLYGVGGVFIWSRCCWVKVDREVVSL